jgi:hypothetical protein
MFVDESGTAPGPAQAAGNPIFVLAGVIIPEDVWSKIRTDLEQSKARHGVVGEIKWRYFAPSRDGSKPHALSHLDAAAKEDLRSRLLGAITKYNSVKVIAVVVETVRAYGQTHINDADDLYHDAFKKLSERFQYFLQDLERLAGVRVNGMIVADNRNNDQDNRLKEFHQTLLTGGRHTSNYGNLIEGLFIAASHHSPGTQFADLAAGAVFRAEARGDTRFAARIDSAFRRSTDGRLDGYGLVRVPRR